MTAVAGTTDQTAPPVRLQRILADAGIASRRHAEDLIQAGRVTVDGAVVTQLGTRADPASQDIRVDGSRIRTERKVYYLVNKPKGVVSTSSEAERRPRVIDLVPRCPQRVYTVGRLDAASEGLILLTNDGQLAHRLAHPRYGVEKTYRVQVAGVLSAAAVGRLRQGVWVSDGKMRPHSVRVRRRRGTSTLLEVVLAEGRNREIRRMLTALGHKVLNLQRIALGGVLLGNLRTGTSRRLTHEEVGRLERAAGIGAGAPKPKRRRKSARRRPRVK